MKETTSPLYFLLSDEPLRFEIKKYSQIVEIDCAKGLMAGEYITDIKYEFDTVDSGFREVERPFIYCRTYNNLPNGYQFTNRVEVGGMYEMQKVKAEDAFTTKIYAPTVDRGKLPKTGY